MRNFCVIVKIHIVNVSFLNQNQELKMNERTELPISEALAQLSKKEGSALLCPHTKAKWSELYADGADRGYLFRS